MKKTSTLGFGILFSLASFANFAPSRLTIAAEGNANIKVTVDGSRFDQQSFSNSVVFNNLQPGFHAVKIYQLSDRRFGFFGRGHGDDYRLVYAASVNIKPLFATTIQLNRFGNAQIIDQPLRGAYDNGGWGRDDRRKDDGAYKDNDGYRKNDRDDDYDKRNDNDSRSNGYYNNNYNRAISNQDFFAAERVMERENLDDARLLYAKRLIDDNSLCAEQVKELARFFSFDNSRLDFAKYAYSNTSDRNNFSVVCNAFSSGYYKDQLMNFIKSCR